MKNRGGKLFSFLLILFFATGFFIFPKVSLASEKDLVITEIMFDPQGTDSEHSDWIEIYNPNKDKIIITKDKFGLIDESKEDMKLGKDGTHYLNCHKIKSDLEIKGGDFVIIVEDEEEFKSDYPKLESQIIDSTFSLSSEGDSVRLSDSKCAVDSFFADVSFSESWGAKNNGKTLEKIKYDDKYSKNSWQESFIRGGTPGEKNSDETIAAKYKNKIIINEIFSSPDTKKGEREFVEIYNKSADEISLSDWSIIDDKNHENYFSESLKANELKIAPGGYKYIEGSLDLNNGEDSVKLKDENGNVVGSIKYSSGKERLSYNFDGKSWHWSRFITRGRKNRLNGLPQVKIEKEKEIYKNIFASFSVEAKDPDKDKLKYTWDFGDGHRSYLKDTRHKYEKSGEYTVLLKVFDGSEKVTKKFSVTVNKFPNYKKAIEIMEIMPNPKGKDEKSEYILIKNKSKDEISLKGWSIATGSKNLYNHPITGDIAIGSGKTKKIGRSECKFTLGNKESKMELRSPDGEVVDEIGYKLDKSVKDDAIYQKTEDGWQWLNNEIEQEAETEQENKILAQNNKENAYLNTSEANNIPQVLGAETNRGRGETEAFLSSEERGLWKGLFLIINQRLSQLVSFISSFI